MGGVESKFCDQIWPQPSRTIGWLKFASKCPKQLSKNLFFKTPCMYLKRFETLYCLVMQVDR